MRKFILLTIAILLSVATGAFGQQKTTEVGRSLIRRFEGCRLRSYQCPAGIWTVGYGNTQHARPGLQISQETAETFLIEDLVRFEKHVSQVRRKLEWNEFDALVSYSFNVGYRVRKELKSAVERRQNIRVAVILRQYVHARGRTLQGLVRRREAEIVLYNGEILEGGV